jgi:hypothetical protein
MTRVTFDQLGFCEASRQTAIHLSEDLLGTAKDFA